MERPCSCAFDASFRGGHTTDCEFRKSWAEMFDAWRSEVSWWDDMWKSGRYIPQC